jgi:hypothetical protein
MKSIAACEWPKIAESNSLIVPDDIGRDESGANRESGIGLGLGAMRAPFGLFIARAFMVVYRAH